MGKKLRYGSACPEVETTISLKPRCIVLPRKTGSKHTIRAIHEQQQFSGRILKFRHGPPKRESLLGTSNDPLLQKVRSALTLRNVKSLIISDC
jgi:hypothetical protein